MRPSISIAVLFGISVVAALQNPHGKAAKYAPKKKQPLVKREAPTIKQTSSYLTNSTARDGSPYFTTVQATTNTV